MMRRIALWIGVGLCFGISMFSCAGEDNGSASCEFNSDCQEKAQQCKNKKCVAIVCAVDDDCRGGWYCNPTTKKCQSTRVIECKDDTDCKNSEMCNDSKCVAKPECKNNSDCTDASKPECKDSKCIEKSCTNDSDCGDAKLICKESKCIAKPVECEKDADCKDSVKTECKDGACVEPACGVNTDCKDPSKPICTQGKCSADTGKAEGEVCEPGTTNCKVGLICIRPDTSKPKGTCQIGCNPFRPKCPTGRVCQQIETSNGVCRTSNKGKGIEDPCDKDNPCEFDLVCREWKGKTICMMPCDPALQACEPKQECYTFKGKNPKSYCVSRRDPCGLGRPCTNDYLCENGFCNPVPSCEDITCPAEQVCDKGICRGKRCPEDISCPTNSICQPDGTCAYSKADPGCVACSQQQPCGGNSICLSGFGGAGASTSHCFDNCTAGSPCSNGNFTCTSISVRLNGVTCTSNTDCTRQDPRFTICNAGVCNANFNICTPKIGSCTNQCKTVNCQNKDVCVPTDGTCVTPYKPLCSVCKHAEECGGAKDLCVTITQGTIQTSYCGRDCSKDPCPTGYTCSSLQNGAKQCTPTAQKCPP